MGEVWDAPPVCCPVRVLIHSLRFFAGFRLPWDCRVGGGILSKWSGLVGVCGWGVTLSVRKPELCCTLYVWVGPGLRFLFVWFFTWQCYTG